VEGILLQIYTLVYVDLHGRLYEPYLHRHLFSRYAQRYEIVRSQKFEPLNRHKTIAKIDQITVILTVGILPKVFFSGPKELGTAASTEVTPTAPVCMVAIVIGGRRRESGTPATARPLVTQSFRY